MKKNEEPILRPMAEHPEPDTVVRFHFIDRAGYRSSYTALWTGAEWKARVPYSIDEWEEMPQSVNILGWDNAIDHQELLKNRTQK